uniref:Uncharacterized protein n=1 Tax=viral metagenome TaxID=1070528 RepID=A0A6M3K044_9ZZZZ
MFSKKELQTTKTLIDRKKGDILNSKKGSDGDYIRDLQSLITLENAVDKKLEQTKESDIF